jgi:predicted permease
LFASVPALRASRVEMTPSGRKDLASTRHAVGGSQTGRLLVIVQVALSQLLLIGAALFLRSLENLNTQQRDVDRTHVLVMRVEPRGSDQRGIPGTTDRLDRVYRDLLARIEKIPGVTSASLARSSPLSPIGFTNGVRTSSGEQLSVPTLMLYPHYFTTMGMSLSEGRDFEERDLRPGSPLVAIVNEAFVRDVLQGQRALGVRHGATIMYSGRPPQTAPFDIIGIVKDSPYPNLREQPAPMLYQTFLQTRTGRGQMVLHVRVAGPVGPVTAQVRDAVQRIDQDVPMFPIQTLAAEVDATLVRERLVATLAGFFGVVALLLVCVGLYGLMSFTVSRRTSEIGVRMALGARRADVIWMVVRQTLTLVLTGIVVGLPIAMIVARLTSRQLSGLLFELTPTDPLTMVTAAGVLLLVAMCAGWLPAHRAAGIDPTAALRND